MAKDKVDPMALVYNRADQFSVVYANDPYWKALKAACDALRAGKVSQLVLDQTDLQRRCQGPSTPNHKTLVNVLEKLKECEVV